MPDAPFACPKCTKVFTRRENLDRHRRAQHSSGPRPLRCETCHALFTRRDVLKRHVQRCIRNSNTRSRRRPLRVPSPLSPVDADDALEPDTLALINTTSSRTNLNGTFTQSDDQIDPADLFRNANPEDDGLPSPSTDGPAVAVDELLTPSINAAAAPLALMARYDMTLSTATAATAAYFLHIHPSLPILHQPTFSLDTTPRPLALIIIAIGLMYSPQAKQEHIISNHMRQDSFNELETLVQNQEQSMFYTSPWTLQTWILHIVYAFYFNDGPLPSSCWIKLQNLIRHLRSCCLMNEQLTLLGNDIQPWLPNITHSLLWTSDEVCTAWQSFILLETYRHCVFAVLFLDHHMTTPCNTRPSMSNVELCWDLPMPSALWEAPCAEEWFNRAQVHRGALSDTADPNSMLSLARATQLLMTGSPPSCVLERLSNSTFAAACMLVSLESLIRDFTACCYRMPPVLPDPSAYHVLSPEQNRAINAAINTMLVILARSDTMMPQIRCFLRASCWLTRIQLCEPDDLIVSGIVDDTLLASLSTSAHLVLGSSVALRRAAAPIRRRFGEDCSFQAWDDMLKAFGVITESARGEGLSAFSPWMIVVASRLLLILWKTLRRAVGEIEQSRSLGVSRQRQDGLGLASVLSSVIVKRIALMLDAKEADGEDHRGIEHALLEGITNTFSRMRTPVSDAIYKVWQEVATLVDG